MDNFYFLVGEGNDLNAIQMSVRAFIMFFITLVLIRLGGMRIFGKKSSFDTIIIIMLGAILSRGVVGASPFLSTIAAWAVMILVHRVLARMTVKSERMGKLLKGEHIVLYKEGNLLWNNMMKASMSKDDLMESLRLETQKNSLEEIEMAIMETNGRISFIEKKQ